MIRIGITVYGLSLLLLSCVVTCALAQEPPKAEPENKFQAAQRHVFTALNLLEAYVRENPNGNDCALAKVQLRTLKGLSPSSAVVAPVKFWSHNNACEWNVASVDVRGEKTVVTLKIRNKDQKEMTWIQAFDTHPLVMLDNNGEFYAMKKAPAIPTGVKVSGSERKKIWTFQPQRVLTVPVVFEPLSPDATGGRILYKDNDDYTTPAEFTLLNKEQAVK